MMDGNPTVGCGRRHCEAPRIVTSPQRIGRFHPAVILMALDAFGLVVASYLSYVELQGQLPYCGPLSGCETVALSEYARVGGVPVAVFGVGLSITLFVFAFIWWRTNETWALAIHYGLSLVGTLFEVYFTFVELFVIHAVCIWCALYGISLVARFLVALWVWTRRPKGEGATA
jgi:uncharacterized membrane protein